MTSRIFHSFLLLFCLVLSPWLASAQQGIPASCSGAIVATRGPVGYCSEGEVIDCNGDCGGPFKFDSCRVCGGENVCVDCNGDCFGKALVDSWGGCCYSADLDCRQKCNGGFQRGNFGGCCDPSTFDCRRKCNGDWKNDRNRICCDPTKIDCLNDCNGRATKDAGGCCVPEDRDCLGTCGGGATDKPGGCCYDTDRDCLGVCNGAAENKAGGCCLAKDRDCLGVCNGKAENKAGGCCVASDRDCRGKCGGSATNKAGGCCLDSERDCRGVCGGSAYRTAGGCCLSSERDCRGICGGSATNKAGGCCLDSERDCRGVCNGAAQNLAGGCCLASERDCAGTCNGSAERDCNGTCGGDYRNWSCPAASGKGFRCAPATEPCDCSNQNLMVSTAFREGMKYGCLPSGCSFVVHDSSNVDWYGMYLGSGNGCGSQWENATHLARSWLTNGSCGCMRQINMGCFTPETRLLSSQGLVRIDSLAVGDTLVNPVTGQETTIERIIQSGEKEPLVRFGIEGRIVEVTQTHPVWTERGLVKASELTVTDSIMLDDGTLHRVEILEQLEPRIGQQVLNIIVGGGGETTEADHYVSSEGIVTGDMVLQMKINQEGE